MKLQMTFARAFLVALSITPAARAQGFGVDPIGRIFNGAVSSIEDNGGLVVGNFDWDPMPDLLTGGLELKLWGVRDGQLVQDGSFQIASGFYPKSVARMNSDPYPDLLGSDGEAFAILDGRNHGFAPYPRMPAGAPQSWDGIGDIDGDGLDDLIVRVPGGVTVYRNRGDHFAADHTVTGWTPSSLVLGDMDGDGDCDGVIGAYEMGNSLLLLRNVAGHLEPSDISPLDAGHAPFRFDASFGFEQSLRVADIDGDNHLDILSVGYEFHVYWNDGSGRFVHGPDLPQYPEGISDVAVADVDGNGTKDLTVIAPHDLDFQVETLLGNDREFQHGVICFGRKYYLDDGEIRVDDFDGDGVMDLLVLAQGACTLLRGRGHGEFGQRSYPVHVYEWGAACAAANFENGWRDAVLLSTDASAWYYDTDPDGTLRSPIPLPEATGFRPLDLTGDRRDDLIRSTGTAVITRRCLGGLSFAEPETLNVGELRTMADFNGDGILDLLVESGNELRTVPGLGGGAFGPPGPGLPPTYLSRRGVAAADIDGNGVADLASVEVDKDPDFRHILNRVVIYRNDGAMGFVPWKDVPFLIDERYGYPMWDVLFLKLNNDAFPDIAVKFGATWGESLQFGAGDGHGNFTFVDTVALGHETHSNCFADLNQDGLDEFIVSCFSPGSNDHLYLFSNQGGFFGPGINIDVGGGPGIPDVGDFNGDGVRDLVLTTWNHFCIETQFVTVHLNGLRAGATPLTTSITPRIPPSALSIHARPGTGSSRMTFVVTSAAKGLVEISVHDIQGRRVGSARSDPREKGSEFEIDLETSAPLRAGVYWAIARQGTGHATTKILRLN